MMLDAMLAGAVVAKPEFLREGRRSCRVGIENAGKLRGFHFAIDPRVIATELAATHNGHANV